MKKALSVLFLLFLWYSGRAGLHEAEDRGKSREKMGGIFRGLISCHLVALSLTESAWCLLWKAYLKIVAHSIKRELGRAGGRDMDLLIFVEKLVMWFS